MPQMAPLNWLSLYLLWIFIFWLFIIMIYYSFLYQPISKKINKSKKFFNWKW